MKKLNELLGTEFPIIQGGMANIATGEFAAACSNAGALGVIATGGMLEADLLRQQIRICKSLTDKPFGVNLMLMNPCADEMAQIIIEAVSYTHLWPGSPRRTSACASWPPSRRIPWCPLPPVCCSGRWVCRRIPPVST